jgi:hypothetical protein
MDRVGEIVFVGQFDRIAGIVELVFDVVVTQGRFWPNPDDVIGFKRVR